MAIQSVESQILPTVKVVNDKAPDGWVIINKSDLCDDHRLWDGGCVTARPFNPMPSKAVVVRHSDEVVHLQPDVPRVAKGARGKFYIKRGKNVISTGFDSEADAHAMLSSWC